MIIDLDGIAVEILRKSIKHMYLRVHAPSGHVKITAPHQLSLDRIQNHLMTKQAWIHAARARFLAHKDSAQHVNGLGDRHDFLGQSYLLVRYLSGRSSIHLDGVEMHVGLPPIMSEEQQVVMLNAWYKQQMQILLPSLIKKWERIIGVEVNAWAIRSMKTRWGSCNVVKRRITLNLRLIQKPIACLESVIVHELVHLLEANHSKRFYALMTQFMPEWREHQRQL